MSCHYKSFVFPDYFLKFYFGSPAGVLVDSISENEGLEFYPYEILLILSTLWLTFRKNILLPPQQQENIVSIRMQKFLNYTANHYAEDISLESLAKSGNVGFHQVSHFGKCFKEKTSYSPKDYRKKTQL